MDGVQQGPKTKFLLILLIIVTCLSSLTSGFLFWQNTKLRQQISQLTTQPSPSPTPLVSPKPSANTETADWKTYTGDGFSFKYPAQWDINPLPWDDSQLLNNGILLSDGQRPNEDQISLEISSTKMSDVMFPGCKQIQQVLLDNVAASRCEITQEISAERGIVYNPPIISKIVYIEALHNGLYYIISLTFDQTSDKFKILDQILSTFEFID